MRAWRITFARAAWHAHPARPGPEYTFLSRSQWWTRDAIAAHQARSLRALVAAASRVPFYRDRFRTAGVEAADIRTLDDLTRLPVLERDDLVRLGVDGIRTRGSWGLRASSSGSMGRPVQLLWPLTEMRWRDAAEARAHHWLGADIGERRLEVRCRPVGRLQAIAAAALNLEAIHAPSVADRDVVRRVVASIERRPPALVWGVSNALYIAALALLDAGRRVRTRACWSGGNHLHPHYREALTQAFQCRVYERYATMETGLIAHECAEGGLLHVPAEGIIAEILAADGTPAAPGEVGDVVVTALRNAATPLIRYRIGDQAQAPVHVTCVCGRGLPVFGTVSGRTQDHLRTASGGSIAPRQAVEAARPAMGSIIDFQAIQDAHGRLRVLVMQRDSPEATVDRERLGAIFEALIAPPERPVVERVAQIALTPGGKIRTLVSQLPAAV
jgi:phenylacetate-CoA ligase